MKPKLKLYYFYIFLDLRKPGYYIYNINGVQYYFSHEPFYVGKGSKRRCVDHFNPHKLKKNTPFYNKLNSILKEYPFLKEPGAPQMIIRSGGF